MMKRRAWWTSILMLMCLVLALSACKKEPAATGSGTVKATATKSVTAAKTTERGTTARTAATATHSTVAETDHEGSETDGNEPPDGDDQDGDEPDDVQEEIFDLGGRVIRVITDQPTRFSWLTPATEQDRVTKEFITATEEKYNCKFNFDIKGLAPPTFIQNVVTLPLMAGTFQDDFFTIYPHLGLLPLIRQNLILPMSDYLDFSNPDVWGNPMIVNQPSVKGRYYMIVRTLNGMNIGMWYNKQIIANEGLTPAPELVAKNNWNWDTFLDMAIKSTRDYNGDGIIDQWGFSHIGLPDLSNAILFANGSEPISESNGSFSFTMGNDPKAYRALNFMQNLFYVYKVAPIEYSLDIFVQGRAAMCSGFDWLNMGVGSGFGIHHPHFALDIFPYGPENPEKKGQAKTNLNGWAAAYNMKSPDKLVRVFAEAMAVWDQTKPGYLSMDAMLQSRYLSSQLHTPDEQRAFVQGTTTSFNFVNAIPGVSGAINGALTKIAGGMAPKSALDEIKNIVEQLCQDNSLQ